MRETATPSAAATAEEPLDLRRRLEDISARHPSTDPRLVAEMVRAVLATMSDGAAALTAIARADDGQNGYRPPAGQPVRARGGMVGQLLILAGALALALAAAAARQGARADPHPHAAPVARAVRIVTLRTGEHPGFSRLVFDLPPGAGPELMPRADGLLVRAPGATIAEIGSAPRGLRGLAVVGDQATLSWAPGLAVRRLRLPGRLIIDVPLSVPARTRPVRPDPMPRMTEPGPRPMPAPHPAPAIVQPAASRPAPPPVPPPARASPPASLAQGSGDVARGSTPIASPAGAPAAMLPARTAVAAAPLRLVPDGPVPDGPVPAGPLPDGPLPNGPGPLALAASPPAPGEAAKATVLPFAAATGAAAFRRGAWGIAVFDEARPLDLAPLRGNSAFASAEVHELPAATVLRVRLGIGQALALARQAHGWSVAVVAGNPPLSAIRPAIAADRLELPLRSPGRVVVVPDPDTGGLLLVGTQAADGAATDPVPQGIAVDRRAPAFSLLATWRGVAVDPAQDSLVLHSSPTGFALESGAPGPALALAAFGPAAQPASDAGHYSRRFDLPADRLTALRRRLLAATDTAAAQPAQDRGPAQLGVAQAMLALGLGAEASALVRLAAADDPRLAHDPRAMALQAAAALLAHRPAEAAGLDNPALTAPGQPGIDETMLWRAMLAAQRAEDADRPDPAAAQELAARLPLLASYPAPLRDRLLPLVLRTMALGGEANAAQRAVDAWPDDRGLDYARALLDEQEGHAPDALARLDRLARSGDRDIAARAAVRAVGLRLDTGALSPSQAADALDPLIYAWRGDRRELAVRQREASLRLQAGQSRAGLALLRETVDPVLSQGWPDQVAMLRERMVKAFAEAIARDPAQRMPALEFVAMVQENADLLPGGAAGQALAERVADRLAALDLPDQAAATLARLMGGAPAGAGRAALGGRLAALQLEQHQPELALRTLSASTFAGLSPLLIERRTLLFARATALRGDLAAATGALEALGSPAADELRASLLENAAKWPEAAAALRRLAQRTLPATGPLNEAQTTLLLRVASAAAQAGDVQTLAVLRARDLARVAPGKSGDLLRVLTEGPVQTVADLPRAGAEMALARTALK